MAPPSADPLRSAGLDPLGLDSAARGPVRGVRTGWGAADAVLGPAAGGASDRAQTCAAGSAGLVRGGVHEWFGTADVGEAGLSTPAEHRFFAGYDVGPGSGAGSCPGSCPGSWGRQRGRAGARAANDAQAGGWSPPLLLLTHLAARAVEDAEEHGRPANVLWIGRSVWPYPRALFDPRAVVEVDAPHGPARDPHGRGPALLDLTLELAPGEREPRRRPHGDATSLARNSLFVDPHDDGQRLWAIDAALRCPSVTAIVADGSRLGMAATRRLQLAAAAALERGGGALVLLARPASEVGEISAATTRWLVERSPAHGPARGPAPWEHGALCWSTRLLRVKGAQVFTGRHFTSNAPTTAAHARGPAKHVG